MKIDVAIVGGGIAGLWCLSKLRALGYDAHIFESVALGAGQTIACQGILHSGAKYGVDDPIRRALFPMQQRWSECINGEGEINLSEVRVLSREMSHCTNGISQGYEERVLDVKSLLTALSNQLCDFIHLGSPSMAKLTVYTCGKGNEKHSKAKRRPLRMFMVKPAPCREFVHFYLDTETKPQLTVTTHDLNGELVWMLGGLLAENVHNSVEHAGRELKRFLAQHSFKSTGMEWADFIIDRAEPNTGSTGIPSEPHIEWDNDKAVAWPIKLTLAPKLADLVSEWVKSRISPSGGTTRIELGKPAIAKCPWEVARWTRQ